MCCCQSNETISWLIIINRIYARTCNQNENDFEKKFEKKNECLWQVDCRLGSSVTQQWLTGRIEAGDWLTLTHTLTIRPFSNFRPINIWMTTFPFVLFLFDNFPVRVFLFATECGWNTFWTFRCIRKSILLPVPTLGNWWMFRQTTDYPPPPHFCFNITKTLWASKFARKQRKSSN